MTDLANLATVAATGFNCLFPGVANLALVSFTYFSQPKDTPAVELVRSFRGIYPTALKIQPALGLAGLVTSAATAYLHRGPASAPVTPVSAAFGVAAASHVAILVLTRSKILPLDAKLLGLDLSPPKAKGKNGNGGDAEARALLEEWGRLHAIRTGLAMVALGSSLVGVHSLLPK